MMSGAEPLKISISTCELGLEENPLFEYQNALYLIKDRLSIILHQADDYGFCRREVSK